MTGWSEHAGDQIRHGGIVIAHLVRVRPVVATLLLCFTLIFQSTVTASVSVTSPACPTSPGLSKEVTSPAASQANPCTHPVMADSADDLCHQESVCSPASSITAAYHPLSPPPIKSLHERIEVPRIVSLSLVAIWRPPTRI